MAKTVQKKPGRRDYYGVYSDNHGADFQNAVVGLSGHHRGGVFDLISAATVPVYRYCPDRPGGGGGAGDRMADRCFESARPEFYPEPVPHRRLDRHRGAVPAGAAPDDRSSE